MTQILRQSTEVIVRIGPAVAVGDGFTPVTTLDLSTADEAELLKANTTTTTSIAAATMAAITGCDGWYGLTLTTSLTDTVGCLDIMVNDDSLILPIFARFQVIEEAAYDAIYAASANPKADINVASIDADAITATAIQNDAITAAKIANGAIDAATFAADVDAEILSYIVDDATRIDASALNTASATTIPAIVADTNELQTDWANGGRLDLILDARASQTSVDDLPTNAELTTALGTADDAVLAAIAALENLSAAGAATAVLTTQMTQSYAANGTAPTLAQAIFAVHQALMDFSIAGTDKTVRQLNGSDTAFVITHDSDTAPTAATRT